jgi:uncharacterized membrane protein
MIQALFTGVFGIGAIAIVYWLTAKAGQVKLLKTPQAKFLAPGALWFVLVGLFYVVPVGGALFLLALAGWTASLTFKAGVKDNERQSDSTTTNQGASQ